MERTILLLHYLWLVFGDGTVTELRAVQALLYGKGR